jgi:NADPH-dependent 2,4-dienoyl-CoA reductase/sulfur reductase-like enzyme
MIGGSDAGIAAALRARECDPTADVTVVVADRFPNYSICGLPFFLSGETPDWHALAHRTAAEIEAHGIRLLLDHTAEQIDPVGKMVRAKRADGQLASLGYDRLVIGTGATPSSPPIGGLDMPGVFFLHSMASSFAMQDYIETNAPRSAAIIGAGYIGLEMADALTLRGISVTLIGRAPMVLPTVEPEFGIQVGAELTRHGVQVLTSREVTTISRRDNTLSVLGRDGLAINADMVLVAVGVRPASQLALNAGITTGVNGAILVDRQMATNVPDIFAAGDCVATWHRLLDRPTYLPLGTTSHKQGRVAGENAVGGNRVFAGTLGTQVVKVFDLAIARTGLLDREAREAGFAPRTVEMVADDHKRYYPGAHPIRFRVTGERESGKLLGAQLIGHWQAEIAKRVDVFATALFHGMTVDAINDLDLSYTPPLGSPWDAVQLAAQAWSASSQHS